MPFVTAVASPASSTASSRVATPFAALAKLAIAVAESGGIPSMAGGGATSAVAVVIEASGDADTVEDGTLGRPDAEAGMEGLEGVIGWVNGTTEFGWPSGEPRSEGVAFERLLA